MTSRAMTVRVLLVAVLYLLVGCKQSPAADPPQVAIEVGVVTRQIETVTLQTELAGRTTAALASELRPQVSGIVKARTFEEGARVKAGQVLYQIDPAMYRAAFEEAKADLASAKATLESSALKEERFANPPNLAAAPTHQAHHPPPPHPPPTPPAAPTAA